MYHLDDVVTQGSRRRDGGLGGVVAVFVAVLMLTSSFAVMAAKGPEPTIWPSKDAYVDGEQVVIYGENWEPAVSVMISLDHPDFPVPLVYSVTAEYDGAFEFSDYYATGVLQYEIPVTVTATQALEDGTVLTATCEFLDPSVFFEGYTLKPHPVWTTGVVKGYNEGDSVPYRVTLSKKFFAEPDESNPETVDAEVWMAHDSLAYDREHHGVDYYTDYPGTTGPFNVYGPSDTPFEVLEGDGVILEQWIADDEMWDDRFGVYLLVWYFKLQFGTEDAVTIGWGAHLALTKPAEDFLGASYWPGASLHGEIFDMQPEPDSGDRDVPIDVVGMLMPPDMNLEKYCDPYEVAEGDVITFTIHWNNTGWADATCVEIQDWLEDVADIIPGSFLFWTSSNPTPVAPSPGPVVTDNDFSWYIGTWPGLGTDGAGQVLEGYLSFQATVTTDVPGEYKNEVYLSYSDDHGGEFPDEYAWCPFCIIAEPSIDIEKSGPLYAHVNETIEYTYTVTNTGTISLENVDIVDDVVGPIASNLDLAPGESLSFTISYKVLAEDGDPLKNNATATGEDSYQRTVSDKDTWEVDILHPEIEVTKMGSKGCAKVGETIWYTIFVTNPSDDTDLTNVVVTDSILGLVWNDPLSLPAGGWEAKSIPYTVTGLELDDPLVNYVTATGEDIMGWVVSDEANWTVDILHPMIEITKEVSMLCAAAGETVLYWINVTNPSEDTEMIITVWDKLLSADPLLELHSLGPLMTEHLGPYEFEVPFGWELVENTAKVDAWDRQEHYVNDSASCVVEVLYPGIMIDKTSDLRCAAEGELVEYTITVTNTGDTALRGNVWDPLTGFSETFTDLAPDLSISWSTSMAMPVGEEFVNIAYVDAWDRQDHLVQDNDTWTVDIVHPLVQVVKWSRLTCAAEGELVEYTITVTNTGDIILKQGWVNDSATGMYETFSDLAPGESVTFYTSMTMPKGEEFTNRVTVEALDRQGHYVDGYDTWTVDIVHPSVSVVKWSELACAKEGEVVTYWINVTNTGDIELTYGETVDFDTGFWSSFGSLLPGESVNVSTYMPMPMGEEFTNHVDVWALDLQGHRVEASDSWTVDIVHPSVEVVKWSELTCAAEGELVEYTITVTNTGDIMLSHGYVNDTLTGMYETFSNLAVGVSKTFYTSMVMPAGEEFTNYATVEAWDLQGHYLEGLDRWDIDIVHPAVSIVKTADKACAHEGEEIEYTITVTNTGDITLKNGTVHDELLGIHGMFGDLAPGGVFLVRCWYTVPEDSDLIVNLAWVYAEDLQGHPLREESTWVVEILHPDIAVTKEGPEYAYAGQTITYYVNVTNTGDTDLFNVTVVDSLVGSMPVIPMIAKGDTVYLDYTYLVPAGPGNVDNRVDVAGEDRQHCWAEANATWTVVKYARITGYKVADLNMNGQWDDGEEGILGWIVTLTGPYSEYPVPVETRKTDGDGYFEFLYVKPGIYTINETMLFGWQNTTDGLYSQAVGPGDEFVFVFLNMATGSISGHKWRDVSGEGTWDAGEPPIQGWWIHLTGTDINGDAVDLWDETDINGIYIFDGLLPGEYTVSEEMQDGWYPTTDVSVFVDVLILAPFEVTDIDFGNARPGTITGIKWLDEYMNGYWDGYEPRLEGWKIWIEGTLATGEPYGPFFTLTDKNGVYTFDELLPGTYRVWEEMQDGWTNITRDEWVLDVVEGSYITCAKFGNVPYGSIAGLKFLDWNMNTVKDGAEPGLEGWEITLTGYLNDGDWPWLPEGATPVGPITLYSNASGGWNFTGLLPGVYKVEEEDRIGWYHTTPDFCNIWLTAGRHVYDIKFGNVPYTCIWGHKVNDLNANGTWDDGEEVLPGWTIIVEGWTNAGEHVYIEMVTDQFGSYATCLELLPGTYTVMEVLEGQTGWVPVMPQGGIYRVVLPMSLEPQYLRYDFLNYKLGCIYGYKYEDMNGNGVYDAGEDEPLEGWEISLWIKTPAGLVPVDETTTGADGNYSFCGLWPGKYIVKEESRTGWVNMTPLSQETVVQSGSCIELPPFLNVELSKIYGYKFVDLNSNGIWDPNEPGKEGWKIFMIWDKDATEYNTTTDQNGYYEFTGLMPDGFYYIWEEHKDGWTATNQTWEQLSIRSGDCVRIHDFGNFENVLIQVFKFEDMNGDGEYDDREDVPLEGWQFEVTGPGVTETITTDSNGEATLTVTAAGTYTVSEVVKDGWCPTTDTVQSVSVLSGSADPEVLMFGNFECVWITLFKYEDMNSSGEYEGDDEPIEGWDFYLYEIDPRLAPVLLEGDGLIIDPALVETVTTGPDGTVSVRFCSAGYWLIWEELPEGWCVIDPSTGEYLIEVKSGEVWNMATQSEQYRFEFGNFECVRIVVFKYWDTCSSGWYAPNAGDEPVEDWLISIYDAAGALVDQDWTDEYGYANFTLCRAGLYYIVEETKEGWSHITPLSGMYEIEVESGDVVERWFGNYLDVEVLIFKYNDLDSDGEYDEGSDIPIPDWEFVMTRVDGMVTYIGSTDGTGHLLLTVNRSGIYTITEEDREGWTHVDPAEGFSVVNIVSGIQVDKQEFGNFHNVSVVVFKFDDLMADGEFEGDDKPIEDWAMTLMSWDGQAWVALETKLTNESGLAEFWITSAGKYAVVEEQKDGWMWISPQDGRHVFDVRSCMGQLEYEFANFKLGMIYGYKWNDLDGDGVWDLGEPPLEGWTIWFECIEGGFLTGFDVTNETGYYEFTGLPPGTYRVWELIDLTAWVNTTPHTVLVTIVLSHTEERVDFLNFELGCIYGYKYEDMNGNSTYDAGDEPLEGWTIFLSMETPAGIVQVDMTTTGADGNYSFCGLGPGTYIVREESRTGWVNMTPKTETIVLTSGAVVPVHDFLNVELSKIYGYKFVDMNSNGVWDQGEPGKEGWKIFMIWDKDATEYNTTTDRNGYYEFTGLMPDGFYYVWEEQKDGWTSTNQTWEQLSISSGDCVRIHDFGNFENVWIDIFKFEDVNGNGVFDAGDGPLEGWNFTVRGPAFTVPLEVKTGSDGWIHVEITKAGTYNVTEEDREGWMHTVPLCGYYEREVTSGVLLDPLKFGNFMLGTITGLKFYDWDMDGVWDEGDEEGLGGWVIWINGTLTAGGYLNFTRITDGDGLFSVTGLPAGTYVVSERLEFADAGWWNTTSFFDIVGITSGLTGPVIFGNTVTGVINGNKFYDKNSDGDWDEGEPGLPEWTVVLEGVTDHGEPVYREETTDANGWYEFDLVSPGSYTVTEVLKADWTNTTELPVVVDVSGTTVYFEVSVDLGNVRYAWIHGYKFLDTYETCWPFWPNGVFDPDEFGIGNWEITLQGRTDAGDLVDLVTYTDNSMVPGDTGYYEFTKVLPGTYWVNETLLPDYYATTSISNMFIVYAFPNGKVEFEFDFGNCLPQLDPDLNFVLKRGWNLWSTPMDVDGLTAKGLLEAIGPAGLIVVKYDKASGTWPTYVGGEFPSGDDEDFTIELGEGYFVWVSGDVAFTLKGNFVRFSEKSLTAGWNIVGYNTLKPTTASQLLKDVEGCNAWIVSYLDAGTGVYHSFVAGDSDGDFVVTQGNAYFVWVDGPGTLVYPDMYE